MTVLIVTGGFSSEREISLISASAVKESLEKNNFKVLWYDLKDGLAKLKRIKNIDVIFPVLHGEEGEGGKLHQMLSKLNKPIVGGDPKGFKRAWYKIPFKKFCDDKNILTSPWQIIKDERGVINFGFPSVLKSSSGGSSREVVILQGEADLKTKATKNLLNLKQELFIEKFLPGVEVTASILDNKALPVVEIIPPAGEWFDYENKYSGESSEIPNAPSLSKNTQELVQEISLKIHKYFNLGHYSRIDFIVSNDNPYVLEVNTIPGLTPQSLFPKAAQAAGISFESLMKQLVELAIQQRRSYDS